MVNWALRMKERGAIFLIVGGLGVGAVGEVMVVFVVLWFSSARGFGSWGGVVVVDIEYRDSISFRSRYVYLHVRMYFLLCLAAGYTANHLNPRLQSSWSAQSFCVELSYGSHEVQTVGYPSLCSWMTVVLAKE
jgi:hypothetical protein